MKYLGQDNNANEYIRDELTRAGIEVIKVKPYTDNKTDGCVEFNLEGLLKTECGNITFQRDWYYWRVNGNVPLYKARLLYQHPEGKASVRVTGHCGCPPPEEPYISWLDNTGQELAPISEWERYPKDSIMWEMIDQETMVTKTGLFKLVNSPEKEGKPYITSYHIDTQSGLLLFAEVIKGNLNIR